MCIFVFMNVCLRMLTYETLDAIENKLHRMHDKRTCMNKHIMDNKHICLTIQKDNEHVWIKTQMIK